MLANNGTDNKYNGNFITRTQRNFEKKKESLPFMIGLCPKSRICSILMVVYVWAVYCA